MPPQVTINDPQRARIVAEAHRLVGVPYRYGGESPATGMDCSGLTRFAFGRAGIDLPRSTKEQFTAGRPQNKLVPGDLLFFDIDGGGVSHVGIYVGNGQMIHASSGGGSVRRVAVESPYWTRRWRGAVSVLDAPRDRPPMAEPAFTPRLSGA